mmetsp:Transcript_60092/g.159845  ORF Transcript_60092/g.159845 Transcript_60092/m.159845 type:complete len:202 (-) Transcript_60092:1605-2210(-)
MSGGGSRSDPRSCAGPPSAASETSAPGRSVAFRAPPLARVASSRCPRHVPQTLLPSSGPSNCATRKRRWRPIPCERCAGQCVWKTAVAPARSSAVLVASAPNPEAGLFPCSHASRPLRLHAWRPQAAFPTPCVPKATAASPLPYFRSSSSAPAPRNCVQPMTSRRSLPDASVGLLTSPRGWTSTRPRDVAHSPSSSRTSRL